MTVKTTSTSGGYVHREPGVVQRALVWLFWLGVLGGLGYLIFVLASSLRGRTPGAGVLFIPGGGWKALLMVLAVAAVMAVTSLIGQQIGQRRKRRRISYLAVLGDQLTHLFLWIVIFAAIYPLVFVVFTSFDPTNSITIFPSDKGNLLQRAGLMPDLNTLTLSNYRALFDGVVFPGWQVVLAVLAGVSLLALLGSNLVARMRGQARPDGELTVANPVSVWAGRALVLLLALLVIFLSPAQFQGQGNESKFLLSIRNTMLIAGMTGLLGILLSAAAGYAMARLRFPGRFQTLLMFIFLQMFPVFLGLVAIRFVMETLGLMNTFSGLILAYSGGAIAFNTWIFKSYVESLPISLEEAAMVDGATHWQTFLKVILPLSGGMLLFMFLNQFIGTYAEYILASQLLTGIEKWTVGILLQSFTEGQFSTKWGVFAAAAVLGALPIALLFYSFQRYFVSGAVAGGVKE